jgi:hypothetical protein
MNCHEMVSCARRKTGYVAAMHGRGRAPAGSHTDPEEATMNRDQLIRERRLNAASWPGLAVMYGLLVGALVASGMAIT